MNFYLYELPLAASPKVGTSVELDGCDGFFDQSLSAGLVGTSRWVLEEAEDALWECHSLEDIRTNLDIPAYRIQIHECNDFWGSGEIVEVSRFLDLAFAETRYPLPEERLVENYMKALSRSEPFVAREYFFERAICPNVTCGFQFQTWYRVLALRGNDNESRIIDFPV